MYSISLLVTAHYSGISWVSMRWGAILKRLQNEEEISVKTHLHPSSHSSSLMTLKSKHLITWTTEFTVKKNFHFIVRCAGYCAIFSSKSTILCMYLLCGTTAGTLWTKLLCQLASYSGLSTWDTREITFLLFLLALFLKYFTQKKQLTSAVTEPLPQRPKL